MNHHFNKILGAAALGIVLYSCESKPKEETKAGEPAQEQVFGTTFQNKKVETYEIKNANGMKMKVTNFGARVTHLWVPDKDGNLVDVVLGFETLDEYTKSSEKYFGAAIGRYGNRIADGKFTLNGEEYTLPQNNNGQTLHGGPGGMDFVIWDVEKSGENGLIFSYTSPDGEEGFPGELKVKMIYTLTDDNEFKVTYEAETDKATPVNLTHHSFFNLNGAGNGDVLDHTLKLNASKYTPVDEVLIPTGEVASVKETPFDFTTATKIGDRIDQDNQQLKFGGGYDHNWVLDKSGNELTEAAVISSPQTGIEMEVWTTEPAIQFYSGNFLDGTITGKGGKVYELRSAFCLETQHYPDSPNQTNFPSTILEPGKQYEQTCIYKFGTK
ncbi:galactose mutarotase [Algoriphagus halophytocola]|uniref:Aldose 1-epimerase n=1 Tax=Algoriphagus halophytocola TaxID=2991499 RepID=A0ABY6MCL4_9BACT|nr:MULTISPECIES: aldose epimerase family protein [unclassified Algoriphagus]UZD21405.1 galactose mutarotase [Algoriphagus sp. TR-M5]WBL42618.1 galactose mutarotase [Algoriphagus sp. TR-M9]